MAATASTFAVPSGRVARPKRAPYWVHAHLVVVAIVCMVAVRLHELFPALYAIKPVMLSVFGGMALLLYHTPDAGPRVLRDPYFRRVCLYYGWILITAPFALWMGRALEARTIFIPVFAMAGAFALCPPTRKNLEFIQIGFVVATTMLAIKVQLLGATIAGRLTGIGSFDSNDLAALMAFVFPLAVALLLRGKGKVRWLAMVAIPSLALAIAGTASRGGLLALGVAVMVLICGVKGIQRPIAMVLVVAGGLATWSFGPPVFRERVLSLGELETDYNMSAYTGRKMIWARARGYLMDRPIAGVGWSNFEVAEGRTLAKMNLRLKWSAAHNSYVQAFVELGFVGGFIFLYLLGSAALASMRLWHGGNASGVDPPPGRPELLAALAAFCASGYFLSHAYSWPLFALLGLIFFAERTTRAEMEQQKAAGTDGMAALLARTTPAARRARTQGRVVAEPRVAHPIMPASLMPRAVPRNGGHP